MKTIILVALVAVAIAHASVIPEEADIVERSFISDLKHKAKKVIHHATHEAKKLGKKVAHALKDAGHAIVKLEKKAGVSVVDAIKKTFKEVKTHALTHSVAGLFLKHSGEYIGSFIYKDKTVGHFFSQVVKGVTKIKVFNDGAIKDFIKHSYNDVKNKVRAFIKDDLFDTYMRKLIGLIDSSFTNMICAETAGKVFELIVGSAESEEGVDLGPMNKLICKMALQYVKIEADKQITVVEEKV